MANFEERLTALEGVVERLERGDLSLEDSVKLFEEGLGLSNACKAELEAAEGKIQLLVDKGSGVMTARAMEIEGSDAGEDEE
jgi:exodeoxyribonuclease VII small subunit